MLIFRLEHWNGMVHICLLGLTESSQKNCLCEWQKNVGGVVLPMLFMGPDRVFHDRGTAFYGMDINTEGALNTYCVQQMKGSAYWMAKALFRTICAVSLPNCSEQAYVS